MKPFVIALSFAAFFLALCAPPCFALSMPSTTKYPYATPTTVRQGDCFTVVCASSNADFDIRARWFKKTIPFLPNADGSLLTAYLPVPIDAKPGKHEVLIAWVSRDNPHQTTLTITVIKRAFATQHLRMSAQQEAIYSDPSVDREYKLIRAALGRFSPTCQWQDTFIKPVAGRVSTSFGLTRYRNGVKQSSHKGLDIAAPLGRDVRAANTGVVALTADDFKLHGHTVIIDHGRGVCTLYLHLSRILVKPGQMVKKGDVIAQVGSTGVATGPHLHYALYVADTAVDPAWWEAAAR
jgi:murein DD-endopeptidase MepM/ murein hydrolase activator NlpD